MGFFEVFAAALAGFYALIPSFGLAIILLTLAVRILLLPLSIKQTRSMREMQKIQPEVKRIQAKHKGDRQKMNEEMMALYKEHGVNPLGGCLPLLMQLPVLIGLFYVIRTPLAYMGWADSLAGNETAPLSDWITRPVTGFMETLQESRLAENLHDMALSVNQFLGLRLDCSSAAALGSQDPSKAGAVCGDGIVDAVPYLILVVLMGLSTWYQQKQMQGQRQANDQTAQQMQMIGKIMPIMLMVFAYSFPTGVVLYWLTTNIWTIAQQRIILKAAPLPEAPGAGGDGKALKAPRGKPPSGKPQGREKDKPREAEVTPEPTPGTSKPHPRKKKR